MMLNLDDKRWGLLSHAYGRADKIPQMIEELKGLLDIDLEKDQLLYGYLCHQYTTYSATYAAIPHIVEIALQDNQTIKNKVTIVEFCGNIHALKDWDKYFKIDSPNAALVEELTLQIESAYFMAIRKIKPLAVWFLAEKILDDSHRFYVFYSFLAFEGFEQLSKIFILSNFTEFNFDCSECGYEHFLYQDGDKMIPNKEDYDFELTPAKIDLQDSFDNPPAKQQMKEWVLFYAEKFDVKPVKYQIPYLFGEMICPNCDKKIRIIDALSQDLFDSKLI